MPRRWIASGLLCALGTGLSSVALGYPFMTTHTMHLLLPLFGEVHLASATFFDLGVFLLIEQLRFQAEQQELLPEHRKEKTVIMQRILRNDAQIRTLAEPWLAQFEHMFDGQPLVMH